MAWGLEEVFYLAVSLFQLLLAYLIVRSGTRKTIRAAVGLVMLLSTVQTLNLLAMEAEAIEATQSLRRLLDTAILLTLGFLITQFPEPLGGERGARWARWAWIGALGVATVTSQTLAATVGIESASYALYRDIFHEGAFALITGLFALHFVPRWFETDDGPLRTQALFASVAVAASSMEWGTRQFINLVETPSKLLATDLGGMFHNLTGWFVLAILVRIIIRTLRSRDREAWLLLGLASVPVLLGVNAHFRDPSGVFELAAHVFRPLLFAIALLRFELIDIPERERRWAVPATAVSFSGLAFLMVLALLSPGSLQAESIDPARALIAILVVAGVAWRVRGAIAGELGPKDPGGRPRALQRYRLALEQTTDEEELETIRERLEITETEHDLISALVERGRRARLASLSPAEPGDVVAGRYEVERELGRGGQGRAVAAWDHQEERTVVLKETMRPWEESSEDRREAMERETELVGDIDDPGLASVHGLVEEGPRVYLVRSYVPGPTLGQAIDEHGGLEPGRVVDIARCLAESLGLLHERGLLHLDLKPSNVVLREGRTPVVIDHGTVQQAHNADNGGEIDATQTVGSGTPAGTLGWMAPEQLLDEPLDRRADVFALGALIHHALTGDHHLDLDRSTYEVEDELVRGAPPRDVEGPLGDLLEACLARDRDERPPSMQVIVDRLAEVGGRKASLDP